MTISASTSSGFLKTAYSVFWQLASHQLSMLSLFTDIEKINFEAEKKDFIGKNNFNFGNIFDNDKKFLLHSNRVLKDKLKYFTVYGKNKLLT